MDSRKNISIYIPKAVGAKEYAYDEDQNLRQTMEDRYFIYDDVMQDSSQSILFGILDGHGGSEVADLVKAKFQKLFLENIRKNKDVISVLKNTYHQVNEEMRPLIGDNDAGATATIGFLRLEEGRRILYMSNVGDSAAVLCDDRAAQILTEDHKPSNPNEKARLEKQGVFVYNQRLGGLLAVSRAFGDFKVQGVVVEPHVVRIELRKIHRWIVVASDGLWDVVDPNFVKDMAKLKSTADELSRGLLKTAIANGSMDNISILCLKLN